jgi:hypothetical protein
MKEQNKITLQDIRFVKTISIGSVNPNHPLSEEGIQAQTNRLNQYLNGYPKGTIIGKDVTIGRYMIGQHELNMEKTTYHIGFERKPPWADEKETM